jgi:hypothetical protein
MTYFSRPLRPSFHRLNTLTLAAAIRVHREIHITKTTTTRYDFRLRHKRGATAVAITRLPTYRSIVPPRRRWAWYLIVTSEGNPALLMSVGTATGLMDRLRAVGTDDLANDLERKIGKAKRYAGVNATQL